VNSDGVRGLVLDYGNVLSRHQSRHHLEAMATLAGLPFDRFLASYQEHRHAYDCGLSSEDYWNRVIPNNRTTPELVASLIAADARSWMDYREDVWGIARQFRDAGGRTAILSNGVPEIARAIREGRKLDAWFDEIVISCEVGCAKPDAAIYRICLERLGVPAQNVLFVDDRLENVDAARALGMTTLLFEDRNGMSDLRHRLTAVLR
jgi:putative hydrolase of the HAD superfamily